VSAGIPALAGFAACLAAETEPAAEPAILEELERDWRTRTDREWMARYARACPVAGAAPDRYGWRIVSDPVAGDVLGGIHFLGMDATEPFVGVHAWTRPRADLLDRLARLAEREWHVFRPRRLRLFRAGERWTPPRGEIDQHLVVGRLDALRARPAPSVTGHVRLLARDARAAEPLAERVGEIYREAWRARPELVGRIEPATREELDDCARAGALFEVEIDGTCAGVIAARGARMSAWGGAEVVEEALEPRWWGRGLGAGLQFRLIQALPARLGPWLWGTIDRRNEASLRTARRVGRSIAGSWWFVPLRSPQ